MKYAETMIDKGTYKCRSCGSKKFNNQYLPQFNKYIKSKCPWCGGDGKMREMQSGAIRVQCVSCGAYNPFGEIHSESSCYPINTDMDSVYERLCIKASDAWNKRNDGRRLTDD